MKRRKTLNKYAVGEHGQITNNNPTLSPRTQKLLSIMSMVEAFNSITEFGVDAEEVDNEEMTEDASENNEDDNESS
jgi:hypothetical protein